MKNRVVDTVCDELTFRLPYIDPRIVGLQLTGTFYVI